MATHRIIVCYFNTVLLACRFMFISSVPKDANYLLRLFRQRGCFLALMAILISCQTSCMELMFVKDNLIHAQLIKRISNKHLSVKRIHTVQNTICCIIVSTETQWFGSFLATAMETRHSLSVVYTSSYILNNHIEGGYSNQYSLYTVLLALEKYYCTITVEMPLSRFIIAVRGHVRMLSRSNFLMSNLLESLYKCIEHKV